MPRSYYKHLSEKWTKKHECLVERLWSKHKDAFEWIRDHAKHASIGSLAGLVLLTTPIKPSIPSPDRLFANEQIGETIDKKYFLISDLASVLPQRVESLNDEQEKKVGETLTRNFGVKAVAELDGKRLNRSYGVIGAEQHLVRFPGDSMSIHFDSAEDAALYTRSGMAPGRGAWGYFAQSASAFSEKDKEREKYYIAVQTFLSPGWHEHTREMYDFFRFRKMLVVNPQNGKAVVAVIGDAGPAEWTGKHLGGSPEVMHYLERVDGTRRGPVLYYFIDDPEDKVPLGPINVVE